MPKHAFLLSLNDIQGNFLSTRKLMLVGRLEFGVSMVFITICALHLSQNIVNL